MKTLKIALSILIIVSVASCNSHSEHDGHGIQNQEKKNYTCPMHPEIIRDKPGQCPICGMDLVEKTDKGETIQDTALSSLLKPTNEYVISDIKKIRVKEIELPVEFEATGTIAYDAKLINTVSARVSGRIEKLYVKYKFQPIKKGDRLMDIYSKDLVTEEENYLFLLNNDAQNYTIIKAAENKLLLLGFTTEQVAELKRSKKALQTITIYSPYSGHLHDVTQAQSNEPMSSDKQMNEELQIHEGMYIEKGQTIFNIYNTDRLWAILNIYPEGQSHLKSGQEVKLHVDGVEDTIKAKVDFIEPVLRQGENTLTVRVFLNNTEGKIKVGSIVRAIIVSEKKKGLFLPSTAVLNLGIKNVVFVFENKLFKAEQVNLGFRSDGWVEILSGVNSKSEIAENAQLLIDSEAFVRVKVL